MSEQLTTLDIQFTIKKVLEEKHLYFKDRFDYRKSLLVFLNRTKSLLKLSKKKIYDGKNYRGLNLFNYLIETWPILVLELKKAPDGEAELITSLTNWKNQTTFEMTRSEWGKSIIKRECRIPCGTYTNAINSLPFGTCIVYALPDDRGEMVSLYMISTEEKKLIVHHIVLEEKLKDE